MPPRSPSVGLRKPILSSADSGTAKMAQLHDLLTKSSASSLRLVYVHGMGGHPAPNIVKSWYDQALFGRDMGDKTVLAYYADILHPLSTSMELAGSLGPQEVPSVAARLEVTSRGMSPAKSVEQRVWSEALFEKLKREARLEQHDDSAVDELVASTEDRGVEALGMQAKVLPAFPFRSALTEAILKRFIPDVAAYFFQEEFRTRMQQRVRDVLIPGGQYIVVAHSLGTIITFELLRELARSISVPLWVTLGSPLGIDEVKELLEEKGNSMQSPASVQSWKNFADPLDPVAADKILADEYTAVPPATIRDRQIWNLDSRKIYRFNPHSSTGYLGHPEVGATVRDVLPVTFDSPIGLSVMTRDLANRVGDGNVPVPVLIEVNRDKAPSLHEGAVSIRQNLEALARRTGYSPDDLKIEVLHRYVAAELTQHQLRWLEFNHSSLHVFRIWRNSEKKALLSVSAQQLHIPTARIGYGATGEGISWAVLDTGINADHPHFASGPGGASLVKAHWDCTQLGKVVRAPSNSDVHGHGTHVAGIIAGQPPAGLDPGSPGYGCLGVATQTSLHIYKVLGNGGGGSDASIIKAIDHIASTNEQAGRIVIHGVNLSLGGPFNAEEFGCGFSPICAELRRLWRQGVLVCVAAGNEGSRWIDVAGTGLTPINFDLSIGDPANLEDAIAVGSVHRDSPHLYGPSYFSSRGPTADGRNKPDVVAPGEKIISCNAKFSPGDPASFYVPMSGTSMACPHVSGLLAGFLSVRKEFQGRPDEVKRILIAHAMDLGRSHYHQGAGLPNLLQMLANT